MSFSKHNIVIASVPNTDMIYLATIQSIDGNSLELHTIFHIDNKLTQVKKTKRKLYVEDIDIIKNYRDNGKEQFIHEHPEYFI